MNNFSIVIPVFNEAENIEVLFSEIINSLNKIKDYEIIFVDDSSTDNSYKYFKKIERHNFVKIIKHNNQLGQSHALLSGIKSANYKTIVTCDGDGQNVPIDILKLLDVYFKKPDISLVGGLRTQRHDSMTKTISSKIANGFRSYILEDKCSDTGCGLKVFSKEIFLKLPFFDGIHRFLPALYKGFGYNTIFIPVKHRKRIKGNSKYGTFDRLFKGLVDIVRVYKIINNKNLK